MKNKYNGMKKPLPVVKKRMNVVKNPDNKMVIRKFLSMLINLSINEITSIFNYLVIPLYTIDKPNKSHLINFR
jgi:hypothetical protein